MATDYYPYTQFNNELKTEKNVVISISILYMIILDQSRGLDERLLMPNGSRKDDVGLLQTNCSLNPSFTQQLSNHNIESTQ